MSEKTRVPQFADVTYSDTLVIEGTHECKVQGRMFQPGAPFVVFVGLNPNPLLATLRVRVC